MKILIFTGNGIRHRWVANTLSSAADEASVISEYKTSDESASSVSANDVALQERFAQEQLSFPKSDCFNMPTKSLQAGELNLPSVATFVSAYNPDAVFVFGASIIKEPLISLMPRNRTINMHLGLSPYYRGAATNFWPFVNNELQFVGATLLHLDPGIDTGDIICHVRPGLRHDDTVHTAGNRVIHDGALAMVRIIGLIREGKALPRTPQWKSIPSRYYRIRDLDEDAAMTYRKNLEAGIVKRYLDSPPADIRLVELG